MENTEDRTKSEEVKAVESERLAPADAEARDLAFEIAEAIHAEVYKPQPWETYGTIPCVTLMAMDVYAVLTKPGSTPVELLNTEVLSTTASAPESEPAVTEVNRRFPPEEINIARKQAPKRRVKIEE